MNKHVTSSCIQSMDLSTALDQVMNAFINGYIKARLPKKLVSHQKKKIHLDLASDLI